MVVRPGRPCGGGRWSRTAGTAADTAAPAGWWGFRGRGCCRAAGHLLGRIPDLPGQESGVSGFGGPDPLDWPGSTAASAFGFAAPHDLMTGVLGLDRISSTRASDHAPDGGTGYRAGSPRDAARSSASRAGRSPATGRSEKRPGAKTGSGISRVLVRPSAALIGLGCGCFSGSTRWGLSRGSSRRGVFRSPAHTFSRSWNRYHSATPCFTRRTRMVVALMPVTLKGSSVANRGIPCRTTRVRVSGN